MIFQWDDDGGYISGGWKEDTGTVSGLVGFGKALSFEDRQVAMNDINIQMGCQTKNVILSLIHLIFSE